MTVIDFPNARRRRRPYSQRPEGISSVTEEIASDERGPNMHTFAFRSYDLIVKSDDADLVRDVCCDLDKAQSKLRRLKQRLKNIQEQAAAQVQLLTIAETKLDRGNRRRSTQTTEAIMSHAPKAAIDQNADLEKPLEDVRCMADIVTQMTQHEGDIEAGDVTITAQSWDTLLFAHYHLQELINRLCTQYHGDVTTTAQEADHD
jgi:hypothetical protein